MRQGFRITHLLDGAESLERMNPMKKEYYEQKLQSPVLLDTIDEKKKIHEFEPLTFGGNVVDGNIHKGATHIR